jgi:glycosyltransferase involved in cell wall biosynthesis
MKIVIDLQGGQSSGSRNRGVGRYSLSLTKAMLKHKQNNEIIVVLSGLFLDAVFLAKNGLKGLIDETDIYVWDAPKSVSHIDPKNDIKRNNAEFLRETFIASLNPDIILITSLFEGLIDDAVTSIHKLPYKIPTATILYDLIPFIHPSPYLDNPDVKRWYEEKVQYLKKADLLLSISESSRQEAIEYLNIEPNKVVNISTASDSQFKVVNIPHTIKTEILEKYNLNHDFLMYTGGIDHRKNIEGLIRAYALLKPDVRAGHQLAIVCSVSDEQRATLSSLVKSQNMDKDEVIFTGYIPENDLIALYNLCKAFIFPSWHEGFGLPVLEAMNCGAPVIVSDKSSLPEVVENVDALFNAKSDVEMSERIKKILADKSFRKKLMHHNQNQIKKFSWDQTAIKVIEALENHYIANKSRNIIEIEPKRKLAYISPLPPERSGISDYSAELLRSLIKYYDIDVIIEQEDISDNWISKNCRVHNVDWFKEHSSEYDRTLYHFGNSHFHQHMFHLIYQYPGTVVLHDFFLSGIVNHMSIYQYANTSLQEELYYSHGYKPFTNKEQNIIWDYPINKRVLDHAKGIIVHLSNSKILADKWYGDGFAKNWCEIPLLRVSEDKNNSDEVRSKLNIPKDAFVVCSFGLLGMTKQNQKLLDAWMMSELSKDDKSYLIFVGENDAGEYGRKLEKIIQNSTYASRIKITGWVDVDSFKEYLSTTDIAVQLRTLSRGETSASVLDCMNYSIATIVNANGSMSDLDDDTVYKIEDNFTLAELQNALEKLYKDKKLREVIGAKAKECIVKKHSPEKCAREYFEAIEGFYETMINEDTFLIDAITSSCSKMSDSDLKEIANSISKNHPVLGEKQLFIDVSQLVFIDSQSGIQRVVKSVLQELLANPPIGYRIEPVYATLDSYGYKYAKSFTYNFFGCNKSDVNDEIIDFRSGDVFLGLDLAQHIVVSNESYYKTMRAYGVKTYFIVYDLLPITQEKYFPKEWLLKEVQTNLLNVVCQSTCVICISKSVKDELDDWVNNNMNHECKTDFFHLGADIDNSISSHILTKNASTILSQIKAKSSFLMVGTIELRKGYFQTLQAFEKLWEKDFDITLVIVGKEGWLVDELIEKLKTHPELNKRLFWLEGISDEYLEKVYEASICLIAASEGEGFCLPLIEAAQKKKPIIARNIPVFREVAGEYAHYFVNDNNPDILTECIEHWIELYKTDSHPKSDEMPWLTLEESTKQLLSCMNINLNKQKEK